MRPAPSSRSYRDYDRPSAREDEEYRRRLRMEQVGIVRIIVYAALSDGFSAQLHIVNEVDISVMFSSFQNAFPDGRADAFLLLPHDGQSLGL
jgi:hypothetical protein